MCPVLHPTETRAFLQHMVNKPESTAGKTGLDALVQLRTAMITANLQFQTPINVALIPFSHFFLANFRTRSFPDSSLLGKS